jgi:hypothetical protein
MQRREFIAAVATAAALASASKAFAQAAGGGEMEAMMDVPRTVVKPGEGRSVWLGGMGVVFKVSGADTGGVFAVVEHPIEPGRLVLPHVRTCTRTSIPTFWRGRSVQELATARSSRDQAVT